MRRNYHHHHHHQFFSFILFWVVVVHNKHQVVINAWTQPQQQFIILLSSSSRCHHHHHHHRYLHNNPNLSSQRKRHDQHPKSTRPFLFGDEGKSHHHLHRLYSVTSGKDIENDDYKGDPVLRLPLMEAELATLMESKQNNNNNQDDDDDDNDASVTIMKQQIENLKTKIGNAKTSAEFGVRKSQSEFYEAFSTGNIDAMAQIWSSTLPVRCVHPGMTSIDGRSDVMESWKQIFQSAAESASSSTTTAPGERIIKFEIEPSRTQIDICGGLTAICSCVEKTQGGGELEVINIYKRENGCWKMTLHHAGPVVMRSSGGAIF